MTDDFREKARSDVEVREIAKLALTRFAQEDRKWVDVISCLRSSKIWTVNGVKRLQFRVRPDAEMGTADGMTSVGKDTVTIDLKESVYEKALVGDGRARNTLAHELGHATMHTRQHLPRRATGNKKHEWIKPFESAEHQANVFAAAFLVSDYHFADIDSADEIAIEAGVSFECAKIFAKEMTKRVDAGRTAEKIRQLVSLFKAEVGKDDNPSSVPYLDCPCPNCGQRRVFPVGPKFMCQVCERVSDNYPDGDGS
jgi:hypothetical protein